MPFGANAAPGMIRTVPAPSQIGIVAGAASLADGFPPLTATQLASGGIPPSIQDFNGIMQWMSAWDQWTAAAGLAPYDPAFSTAIGGYPQGATVLSAVTAGRVWISTVDNNAVNPDGAGQTAWLPLMLSSDVLALILANGLVGRTQTFFTSGTFTVPPNVTSVRVEMLGGGGAGGATNNSTAGGTLVGNNGSGGGAGGYCYANFTGLTPGATYAVTVGPGGLAVANAAGGNGGTTSFGALCSATGGAGGVFGSGSSAYGGAGGLGSGGQINLSGGQGGASGPNTTTVTTSMLLVIFARGGLAPRGLGSIDLCSTGGAGQGYGNGGSASSGGSGIAGGNGAPGICIVSW